MKNKLSTFRQMAYTWYSRWKYNSDFRRNILLKTDQYHSMCRQNKSNIPITKLTFEGFQNQTCLARWGQFLDSEFGGSSTSSIKYNPGHLTLSGKIDISDMSRLQYRPCIGLIQKLPQPFNVGIFNSIRVQMMGDGLPVTCQVQVPFKYFTILSGKGIIFTSKDKQWVTYQLPIRNFNIPSDLRSGISNLKDFSKQTFGKLLHSNFNTYQQVTINQISFRLQSSVPVERQVKFKKIELVRTIRGQYGYAQTRMNVNIDKMIQRTYFKPYFYIVDQNETNDDFLSKYNTGKFVFSYEDQYTKQKTPDKIKENHHQEPTKIWNRV